jgi:hypothetical protein
LFSCIFLKAAAVINATDMTNKKRAFLIKKVFGTGKRYEEKFTAAIGDTQKASVHAPGKIMAV